VKEEGGCWKDSTADVSLTPKSQLTSAFFPKVTVLRSARKRFQACISAPYAAFIRAADGPHPRHWQALAELASVEDAHD
jgi:hypothetical protein